MTKYSTFAWVFFTFAVAVSSPHASQPLQDSQSLTIASNLLYLANFHIHELQTLLPGNPYAANFFSEEDLRPSAIVRPYFAKTTSSTEFLPDNIADSLSFASEKLADILSGVSVHPDSPQAEAMKMTLHLCQQIMAHNREEEYCATSQESMMAFAAYHLSNITIDHVNDDLSAMDDAEETTMWGASTTMDNETEAAEQQEYTILSGTRKVLGSSSVVCHAMPYPHKVFYCRALVDAAVYRVPLAGTKDEVTAEGLAVCHSHRCRFLPQDDIVWSAPEECAYCNGGCC